jgi:hypothetical protein
MTSYTLHLLCDKADLVKLKEMIGREHWHSELKESFSQLLESDLETNDQDRIYMEMSDRQSIFLSRWLNGDGWEGRFVHPKDDLEVAVKQRVRQAYVECVSKLLRSN